MYMQWSSGGSLDKFRAFFIVVIFKCFQQHMCSMTSSILNISRVISTIFRTTKFVYFIKSIEWILLRDMIKSTQYLF